MPCIASMENVIFTKRIDVTAVIIKIHRATVAFNVKQQDRKKDIFNKMEDKK